MGLSEISQPDLQHHSAHPTAGKNVPAPIYVENI